MASGSREDAKAQGVKHEGAEPAVNYRQAISLTMTESRWQRLLQLPSAAESALIAGARDIEPVKGLTHGFYKYPARFSPAFVRAAIETLTQPGDLVLDNHVGGGTTLVEALATGRHAIGVDISPLAEFVARVKTTVFSEAELDRLEVWTKRLREAIHIHKSTVYFADYDALGYYKHLDHPSRWRLRKAIEQGLSTAQLGNRHLEAFGRCAVLRTAQWALDGRARLPSVGDFKDFLETTATEMLEGARALRATVTANGPRPIIEIINRSAAGIEDDERLQAWRPPRLVLTSPPYPGVHVLYHRWQVDGRKEAPIPFMIANKLDGAGSSYYTMGDRKFPELRTYFENIKGTMSSVAALADKNTVVVQMVAFSDPSWQLPRYLETMQEAGLTEMFLPLLQGERDGRLWRSVPGRRWYSDQRGRTPGSKEVVLLHSKNSEAALTRPRRQSRTEVRNRP
jgi:DNA methylase